MTKIALLGLALTLCASYPTGPDMRVGNSKKVQSVTVAPDTMVLQRGDSGKAVCTPTNQFGAPLANACNWTSRDTTIATVTTGVQTARITARKVGKAWVVAGVQGKRDSVRVTVTDTLTPTPPSLSTLTVAPADAQLNSGQTQQYATSATWSDGQTHPYTVTWSATGGTITQTGLYTAGATAGTYKVCATSGALMPCVDLTATVPPPTPEPGTLPTPLRTVNVSTTSQLQSALTNALPGDRIVMATGSYSLGFYSWSARDGTATNPIVLTGPRTAVLTGSTLVVDAAYWIFNGFRMTGGEKGIFHIGGSYTIYEYLEIDHVNTEGMEIRGAYGAVAAPPVVGTVIRYNEIHHTGLGAGQAEFGEGIYIADPTGLQLVTGSSIHHNIMHDISSEGIELKAGGNSNTIEFNTMSVSGPAGITVRGNNNVVNDNTITSANYASITIGTNTSTFATGNSFHRNAGSGANTTGKVFFVDASSSGSLIYCDNTATAPLTLGASCIP